MKLLDWFIFAAWLTDSIFGMSVYEQMHVAKIFHLFNYLSGVIASVHAQISFAHQRSLICIYCSAYIFRSLKSWVLCINIYYEYGMRSLSCDVHHLYYSLISFSPIFNNQYTIQSFFFVCDYLHLKVGWFSHGTLHYFADLTWIENHSSGACRIGTWVLQKIPKSLFCVINLSMDKA